LNGLAGAEKEFKRAIELNPNLATAHHWYGDYLTNMGRFDEALPKRRKPRNWILSPSYQYHRGLAVLSLGPE